MTTLAKGILGAVVASALWALPARPGDDTAALRTIERVDVWLQGRFRESDSTFGVSRIPVLDGHPDVALGGMDARAAIVSLDRPFLLAFGHVPHARARGETPREGSALGVQGIWRREVGEEIRSLRSRGRLPDPAAPLVDDLRRHEKRLRDGARVEVRRNGTLIALRPVRAEAACARCHTGAKPGETLGVLVYQIGPAPSPR